MERSGPIQVRTLSLGYPRVIWMETSGFAGYLQCLGLPHPLSHQGLWGGDGSVRIAEEGCFPKGPLCRLRAPRVPAY